METICETCKFWNMDTQECDWLKKATPPDAYCESWEDEDGNTMFGEDW